MKIIDNFNKIDFFELSGTYMPEEASRALSSIARLIKKTAKEYGFEPAGKNCLKLNHFFASGFFRKDDKYMYVSICDPRSTQGLKLLYRTAANETDFRGGRNQYSNGYDMNKIFE